MILRKVSDVRHRHPLHLNLEDLAAHALLVGLAMRAILAAISYLAMT
jgi:hypothetical protein